MISTFHHSSSALVEKKINSLIISTKIKSYYHDFSHNFKYLWTEMGTAHMKL